MSRALLICHDVSDAGPLSGFATAMGVPYDFLVLGATAVSAGGGEQFTASQGETLPADALAAGCAELASRYTHIAAVSSMSSKDWLPRLAGVLGAGMVTDVSKVVDETTFCRPIVAGTLIATVQTLGTPNVFTVRPAGFEAADVTAAPSSQFDFTSESAVRRTSAQVASGSRPDLAQANVVVSGGRPLKDAATFEKVIGGLADKLGGAVGATRAAVDSGIAPNECQVGQTGKIVGPELYIAAGISGSTQHMAGIKDSRIIVAINKDPDAPIFEFADYGLVADLFEAVPELTEKANR